MHRPSSTVCEPLAGGEANSGIQAKGRADKSFWKGRKLHRGEVIRVCGDLQGKVLRARRNTVTLPMLWTSTCFGMRRAFSKQPPHQIDVLWRMPCPHSPPCRRTAAPI